jgi:hypothetical protein
LQLREEKYSKELNIFFINKNLVILI